MTGIGFTDSEKAAAKAACGEITEFFPTSGDAPRVVFCGSREWAKDYVIRREIASLPQTAVVISGGARGADLMAERCAIERRLHTIELCADWEKHGRRAGYLRNEAMLDLLDPKTGVVYAFQVKGSVGTQLTIDSARKRGLTVRLFRDETIEHTKPEAPKTGGVVTDEVHKTPHKPLDRLSEELLKPWTCPDCSEADESLAESGVPESQRLSGFRDITGFTCPLCGRKRPVYSGHHEVSYELVERTDLVATVMDDSIVGAYWAGTDPDAGNRIGFELSCPECGQPIIKGRCACGLYSRAQAVVDADDAIFKEDESKLTDDLPTNAYAHAVGCTCPSCLDDRIGKRIASQKAHGADCRCASCLNGFKDAGFIEIPVSLNHPKTCNCGSCRDRRETLAILY